MSKTSVLIADAQTILREGIKSILLRRNDLLVAGEVKNSAELKPMLLLHDPAIVIVDLFIAGSFSVGDLAMIKSICPHCSILIISTNFTREDVLNVINSGVDSYLLKDCEDYELLKAVDACIKKKKFFCVRIMDLIFGDNKIHLPEDTLCHECKPVLSRREKEIIQLISESYTTHEIAEKLFLSFHTVGTHRKNIFKKLRINSVSELIILALRQGIISTSVQN